MQRFRRKTVVHAFEREENSQTDGYISKSISLFYWIFAIHSSSSNIGFHTPKMCLASIFSIANDIFLIYIITVPWTKLGNFPELEFKKIAAENCIQLCALAFRILIHCRGTAILNIPRFVEKLDLLADRNLQRKFKRKIKVAFAVHFIYFSMLYVECVNRTNNLERIFICKQFNIPTDNPKWALLFVALLYTELVWFVTALPSIFVTYVYFISSLFVASLKQFTKTLNQETLGTNPIRFLLKYDSISQTVVKMNSVLRILLLLICCHILFNCFYSIYISLYDTNSFSDKLFQTFIVLTWNFAVFCLLCTSASNISENYGVMRSNFHELLMKKKRFENLSLALKLCEDDIIGFTILDSICINKSLIVKGFGTMLTYGIMVATLGRTSHVQTNRN